MTSDETTTEPKQLWSHTTVNVADTEAVLLEAKSVFEDKS